MKQQPTAEAEREAEEILTHRIERFRANFCPFGYLDIKSCIETAVEAGHNEEWALERIECFADDCGVQMDAIDPCYVVMDAILQDARTEIEDETGWDMLNDSKSQVDTLGNFMCTQYDYKEEAKDEIIEVLAKNKVRIADLSEATQYFLGQIEITQEEVNKLIKKK